MDTAADSTCIFCKIVQHQTSAQVVFEDESCMAFRDVKPQAPVHLLVIPRKHMASVAEAGPDDEMLIGHLHRVASELAHKHQLSAGYRVVINCGLATGQTIFHLHLHVLGGRSFHWPPG
jgi:histidine triad (HIT) family protein